MGKKPLYLIDSLTQLHSSLIEGNTAAIGCRYFFRQNAEIHFQCIEEYFGFGGRNLILSDRVLGLFVISIGKTHFQISTYPIELLGMNFRNVLLLKSTYLILLERISTCIEVQQRLSQQPYGTNKSSSSLRDSLMFSLQTSSPALINLFISSLEFGSRSILPSNRFSFKDLIQSIPFSKMVYESIFLLLPLR